MVDDQELKRRLQILKVKLEEGKLVVANHLAEGFEESFGRVRYSTDGEIDLSTVDGRVRSTAMVVAMMQDRDDTKSAASLSDIQNAYFDRVTPMFEEAHKFILAQK